eukprot:g3431.t1
MVNTIPVKEIDEDDNTVNEEFNQDDSLEIDDRSELRSRYGPTGSDATGNNWQFYKPRTIRCIRDASKVSVPRFFYGNNEMDDERDPYEKFLEDCNQSPCRCSSDIGLPGKGENWGRYLATKLDDIISSAIA